MRPAAPLDLAADAGHTRCMTPVEEPKRNFWQSVRRGLMLRCPACGRGKVLAGYLKQAPSCTHCGEPIGDIQADDGPAWATILVVGHLVSPVFVIFAQPNEAQPWTPFLIVAGMVIALSGVLLPRMKGMFVGIIWASRAGEAVRAD
jgi:uncharacterized protein (DUF983 family)